LNYKSCLISVHVIPKDRVVKKAAAGLALDLEASGYAQFPRERAALTREADFVK